jgi:hypothetical protein
MRTFNVFDATAEYDSSDPEGYRSGGQRFGPRIGAARLGATMYGTETVRMVMFATVDEIGYAVYPDSNKISFWSNSSDPADRVRVRRGEDVDYYDGEL